MKVKISAIKANSKNPRVIKDDKFKKLVKSIQEFPEMLEKRPLVCYTDVDGKFVVLGGNMRLKASQEIGLKELPIVLADDWTQEQRDEFLIKDNVGFGEWDWDQLANEWDAEKLDEWGLDVPNFNGEVLEAEEDDFDTTPPLEPITVLGDLYEIGEHRLLCGDSTQTDTFEKLMQGEFADMVVTDPPYNVALGMETKEQAKARNRRTDGLIIQNDKMSNNDFYKFLYDFYSALSTSVKKGGSIYVWYASSEVVNFVSALVDSGWLYKQELIWNKTSMIMGRQDYQWKHEPCIYGWLDGGSHNWYSDRKQTTIIDFEKPRETNTLESQGVNYVTGPTFTVNRVNGNPLLGISTSYYVSLRDSRVETSLGLSGKEIGVARVYDFALESGSYESSTPNANEWDLSLYDIQTYTEITLNEPITLSRPTHVKGKSSGSTGFIRYDVTNSPAITVYNTKGKFANGERFIFDGIDGVVQTQKQIILAELQDQAQEQQAEEEQAMMQAQQMQAEQEGGAAPMEEGQMPPEQPMA